MKIVLMQSQAPGKKTKMMNEYVPPVGEFVNL